MKILKKRKNFKPFNQDGQTAVFFALLLPVLILFLFVVFDLGWLYLNKSRLQNAAEAAAIAGANKFCEMSTNDYNNVLLIYENDDDYKKLFSNAESADLESTDLESDTSSNEFTTDEKNAAESAAKESWTLNLGVDNDSKDSWTKAQVQMPVSTFRGEKGAKKIYYEVELKEDVTHIFKVLNDVFSTEIPAVAVVEITKVAQLAERNLWNDMNALSLTQTIGNWEEQNGARNLINKNKNYKAEDFTFYSYPERRHRDYYDGVWNHYQDAGTPTDPSDVDIRRDAKAQVHYDAGNVYKYENVVINPSDHLKDDAKKTSANGNKVYAANLVDALNLDFKQDVKLEFDGTLTSDWDIGFDLTGTGIKSVGISDSSYRDGWGKNEINLRVHATFNFDEPFTTREYSDSDADKKAKAKVDNRYAKTGLGESADADPLYVRIESEPMASNLYGKGEVMKQLNSVRQIILNFNPNVEDPDKNESYNMDTADDERNHVYKYRPLVIFYDGPEKNDLNSKRESQPVIVNLNADFRGILFMPNSPVVINGNGHKFQGFVIAKEFKKLKTESDYAYHYKRDGDNKDIYLEDEKAVEKASGDDWIMVKKNDGTSTDWFKVDKSKLLAKITVEDSAQATLNDNAYTFTYTQKNYAVNRSKLDDSNSFIDGANYDTTTYYRRKDGSSENATPAYVRRNLKVGNYGGRTPPNPEDPQIIQGKSDKWYEVRKGESTNDIWSIWTNNNNSNNDAYYNCLFYKDGWRLITDENGNKKFAKSGTITANCVDLSSYVEVIDAEGNTAYVHKDKVDGKKETAYFQIKDTFNSENRYINKTNTNYYIKKSEDEPLILDLNGNVQYTDALQSEYSLDNTLDIDDLGKTPCFNPATFNLDENKLYTHYSRCGAVPQRRRYLALDDFEEDGGDYCQDMFFTTARSKYVI